MVKIFFEKCRRLYTSIENSRNNHIHDNIFTKSTGPLEPPVPIEMLRHNMKSKKECRGEITIMYNNIWVTIGLIKNTIKNVFKYWHKYINIKGIWNIYIFNLPKNKQTYFNNFNTWYVFRYKYKYLIVRLKFYFYFKFRLLLVNYFFVGFDTSNVQSSTQLISN